MLKQQEDKALLQSHLGNEYGNQIANRQHKEMTQVRALFKIVP